MTIKLIKTDSEFLEVAGTKITNVDGHDWYYMPFWFKKIAEDLYEQVRFENLPNGVKELIKNEREP